MHFDSVNDFLAMGGYGFYVWLAFFVTFAGLIALHIEQKWRTKKLREDVLKEHRRIKRVNKIKAERAGSSVS